MYFKIALFIMFYYFKEHINKSISEIYETKMKSRIRESCSVHESRNRIKKKYQNYGKNRNKKLKLKKETH